MLSPLIRRPGRSADPRSKERGITMALVAVALVTIISVAALSIDIGTLYQAKAEAQRAADAAALTAARLISISGLTGVTSASWGPICGGAASTATQAAISMAQQNLIGGVAAPTASISVGYGAGSSGGSNADCSGLGATFAVNPVVTVSVQRTNLPVYFARIFSLFGSRYSGSSVSATATAEAFNPSGSAPVIPVYPRCVKPWVVPNLDPGNVPNSFIDPVAGTMTRTGVSPAGPVGETFNLKVDCGASGGKCILANAPIATAGPPLTLNYVPGQVSNASVALAANSTIAACSSVTTNDYAEAVAGCDQSTIYHCGTALANNVDLTEDPAPPGNDSVNSAQCLINATLSGLGNGQDYLASGGAPPPYTYPFQILAGDNSALLSATLASGSQITSSPSIVSLPIYDNTATALTPASTGTIAVSVIGFLQVFINSVDSVTGNINVTVMNVSGCGNAATKPAVVGTSPVPVRLITPP
jgi:hypothetical protein